MTSAHDNEYITITATPTNLNEASPNDNVRFPSKTNSFLDLSQMSSMNYHHRQYPPSINMDNSAYPVTSGDDTTHHTCETNINHNNDEKAGEDKNNNKNNNNNIMSSLPNSALPDLSYLRPIDESDPLHSNNCVTSSLSPYNNNNINSNNNINNNNLNTVLFHGVSTASSHLSNHNASMQDYPPRSARSARYEMPNLLDVNHITNNNNNSNNNSCLSIGGHTLNNSCSSSNVRYSNCLL